MADHVMKAGDSAPAISMTLLGTDGQPYDLTGCTARIHIGRRGRPLTVDAAATIVSAAAGTVSYSWQPEQAGLFQLEVEVTRADLSVVTFPNSGFATVRVVEDLG